MTNTIGTTPESFFQSVQEERTSKPVSETKADSGQYTGDCATDCSSLVAAAIGHTFDSIGADAIYHPQTDTGKEDLRQHIDRFYDQAYPGLRAEVEKGEA